MRKLLGVLPLLLVLVGGCDSTRRDYTYCDTTYSQCSYGYTCNFTTGLCVPAVDAAIADTRVADSSPLIDLSSPLDVSTPDGVDAPVVIDVASVDTTQVVDTSIMDAPQPVDVSIPDTHLPDGPGTCSVDNDCVGVVAGAYCVNARCAACRSSSQCSNDAGVPLCSAQHTCVSCSSASGLDGGSACSGTTPVCNPTSGSCVQCVNNSDCPTPGKGFCVQNQCKGCDSVPATAGATDAGTTDASPPDGGSTSTGPCPGATPICVSSTSSSSRAGQCVGCESSSDCSGNTPICDTTGPFACSACTSDDQCVALGVGPGICMFHQSPGGRCATNDETIFVKNFSGCGGTGTLTSPYCQPQDAIDAVKVSTSKRLVVIIGTGAQTGVFSTWTASFTAGTSQVSVIGQNNPIIAPGAADIGIHIVSGNVYIRGLTVQGAGSATPGPMQPAITVDSGATIGLDRCYVMGGAGGLLVNDGAGFDIANSVFAKNQPGAGVGAAVFGGVYLGSVGTTGLPHRFWFNTIADNQQLGIACTSKSQSLDGCLLTQGNIGGQVVNCTLEATTKSPSTSPTGTPALGFSTDVGDPLFDPNKPYHLTSGTSKSKTSPCKDFITDLTTPHPVDDVDGQSRPNGVGIDCGADEYWP